MCQWAGVAAGQGDGWLIMMMYVCVCLCVCMRVCACARLCVCVCVGGSQVYSSSSLSLRIPHWRRVKKSAQRMKPCGKRDHVALKAAWKQSVSGKKSARGIVEVTVHCPPPPPPPSASPRPPLCVWLTILQTPGSSQFYLTVSISVWQEESVCTPACMCTGAAQEFIKYLLYTCLFNYLKPRLASIKNNILLSGVCQYDPVLHKLLGTFIYLPMLWHYKNI